MVPVYRLNGILAPRGCMRDGGRSSGVSMQMQDASPKSVWDRYVDRETFDWVITLCDEGPGLQYPILKENVDGLYAEKASRLSWSISSFGSLSETVAEQEAGVRKIRDQIKREVLSFLDQIGCAD